MRPGIPNPPDRRLLLEIFQRLLDHFGRQHWWPGDSPIEVVVGAVLTQNTAWPNVEKAIRALRDSGSLSLQALFQMPRDVLAERIRPCGTFRVKAERLKTLIAVILERGGGTLQGFFRRPTAELRNILLNVSGIGPETADSILLYAAQRPVFVADAYTRRALLRHGWIAGNASYGEIQALFMNNLEPDVPLFNEYHALWVALGKAFCRTKPRCSGCPLEDLLPQIAGRNTEKDI